MKPAIGLAEALREFNDPIVGNDTRVFSIKWIRTSGPERGRAKTIQRATKYTRSFGDPVPDLDRSSPNMRENSLLRIRDLSTNLILDLKVYSLIEYNGYPLKR